ncbi:MAG: hypothetical protein ACOYBY_10935 [Dermatophilaceae bacterium]
MISSRVFSRHASIWSILTPTLEPVVHWLNSHGETFAPPVPLTTTGPANNALIAETAFSLAAHNFEASLLNTLQMAEHVKAFLARMSDEPALPATLTDAEVTEVALLALNLRLYSEQLGVHVFSPVIEGCGVVDRTHGDILAGDNLIEVKSVTRAFRGVDVRQVLTYCALLYASAVEIRQVTFVNPRRGTATSASLDFVCEGASGLGRLELLFSIAQSMSELQVSA